MGQGLRAHARIGLCMVIVVLGTALAPAAALAQAYAAMVMDARTGEVLHATNADTRLHPASLTKMMTLYIAFEAIRRGEITLDTPVRISAKAANEEPSRLGLRAGQTIPLRFLIRAAAVRSANDAATAIAEAISGSEARFAERMNRTARALGMTNSTFRNAHGLTAPGHLSTARDMTILGRRLIYDFPEYYNIFSRRSADAGVAKVVNTNARFLDSYPGADGIKTGFTRAAGFNLVASAERGGKRIIATVFGGTSTAQRNARVAELLDLGFRMAPDRVTPRALPPADVAPEPAAPPAMAAAAPAPAAAARAPVQTALRRSIRPQPRPAPARPAPAEEPPAELMLALRSGIESALAEAVEAPPAEAAAAAAPPAAPPPPRPETAVAAAPAPAAPEPAVVELAAAPAAEAEAPLPFALLSPEEEAALPGPAAAPAPAAAAPAAAPAPEPEPESQGIIVLAAPRPPEAPAAPEEVVTRLSTSGGRHWSVTLGRYGSRAEAERILLRTALAESMVLDSALRRVVARGGGYEALFSGLTQEQSDLACRRLTARGQSCFTVGP